MKSHRREGAPDAQPREGSRSIGGSLVSPPRGRHDQLGAAGVQSRTPACSTSSENNVYSIFYLTDPDPRGSMGLGGKRGVARRHGRQLPDRDRLQDRQGRAGGTSTEGGAGGGGGVLTTAGRLVFAGDGGGNIVAHDAATGKPLWHSRIGGVTNPPQTYLLDGRQYSARRRRRHAVCVCDVLTLTPTATSSRSLPASSLQLPAGDACSSGVK